ncbi:hypothetical protein LTR62_008450 [Meristemomyces frigidus]|uniref:YDG domain-containing protein n=1 Tax=Meristemomyces frigidus TaxID=1508187 RepID=A0AAN7TLN8_9PEZI|nr:hypothetical protein LTR62_008450 [Meristemomyces frigidus]
MAPKAAAISPPSDNNVNAAVNYIVQRRDSVGQMAFISSRLEDVPPATGRSRLYYDQIRELLDWLETGALMTPELKIRSEAPEMLQKMFAFEQYHFPAEFVQRSRALHERFEMAGWNERGPGEDEEVEGVNGDAAPARKRQRSQSTAEAVDKRAFLPPANHSIWGVDGIMHGVACSISYQPDGSHRRTLVYDERYAELRRSAKVFGHNGITVGTWYPRQLVVSPPSTSSPLSEPADKNKQKACFHGAHGSTQAGISGSAEQGAFSIIVAGHYDDLDTDKGDYLYYSAPNSHSNDDPRRIPEAGPASLALHRSMRNGRPVRVLRSFTGRSRWRPVVGMRYDGLYRVETVTNPTNAKGGLYEQFGLKREDGQPDINIMRPNVAEQRDFARINEPYATGMP